MTAAEFGALVDEYVTPRMGRLGYRRIHLDQEAFDVGYEADSEQVMAAVLPEDPLTAEEIWIHYEPESGRLRFDAPFPLKGLQVEFPGFVGTTQQPVHLRIRRLADAIAAYEESRPNDG